MIVEGCRIKPTAPLLGPSHLAADIFREYHPNPVAVRLGDPKAVSSFLNDQPASVKTLPPEISSRFIALLPTSVQILKACSSCSKLSRSEYDVSSTGLSETIGLGTGG